jgi:hypothetical protein
MPANISIFKKNSTIFVENKHEVKHCLKWTQVAGKMIPISM